MRFNFCTTESDEEDLEPPLSYHEALTSRRKSVFGESYEPDDEELPEKVCECRQTFSMFAFPCRMNPVDTWSVCFVGSLLHISLSSSTHTHVNYTHTHTHTYNYIHTHTPYTGSSLSPSLLCYIRPGGPSQVRLPTKKTNRISQEDIPLQIFRHCEWTRHIFLTNCASQCAANVSSLLCVFCVSAGADK